MAYVLPGHTFTAVFNVGDVGLTIPVSVIKATDGSVVTAPSSVGVIETPANSGIYSKTFNVPTELATYIAVADPGGGAPMIAVEFTVATDIPYIDNVPDGLIDRIKERIENDLSDDELARMAMEAQARIVAAWGDDADALAPITEYIDGRAQTVTLNRPMDETQAFTITEDGTVLTTDDYRVEHRGRTLRRMVEGSRSSSKLWGRDVVVEYVPLGDVDQRQEAIIALVQLAISYEGVSARNVGDVQTQHLRMTEERDRIINSLSTRPGLMMA